jgi:hypothetical protein
MRIGILSDTHGNFALMRKAADILVNRDRVDRLFHLGDHYQDSQELLAYRVPVVAVPGLYDAEYLESSVENQRLEICRGISVLLVHDRTTLAADRVRGAQVVLYGHTHRAAIAPETGCVWCNPGHLKALMDKERPPSFAFIEVGGTAVTLAVKSLENKLLSQHEFRVA